MGEPEPEPPKVPKYVWTDKMYYDLMIYLNGKHYEELCKNPPAGGEAGKWAKVYDRLVAWRWTRRSGRFPLYAKPSAS